MEEKYTVFSRGEVVPHIEVKLCGCGRLLSLSHKGPCPSCGDANLKEMVIISNGSDLDTAERVSTPEEYPMGGSD